MWNPSHPAFIEYAKKVAKDYKDGLAQGQSSRVVVLELAKKYGVSDTHIYRYLRFKNVKLSKTERKRNEQGRYTSI